MSFEKNMKKFLGRLKTHLRRMRSSSPSSGKIQVFDAVIWMTCRGRGDSSSCFSEAFQANHHPTLPPVKREPSPPSAPK